MGNYELLRVLKRKNKSGKEYYLAVLLFNSENNCDLIQALVTEEQAKKLLESNEKVNRIDMTKYVEIEYNTFSRSYQPKITI